LGAIINLPSQVLIAVMADDLIPEENWRWVSGRAAVKITVE
jgi:hypothetical protein